MEGAALVEEREPGGLWSGITVRRGDFFITDSDTPYELRWRAEGEAAFEVMHVYVGLALLKRAAGEVFGARQRPLLREVSGVSDARFSALLEAVGHEVSLGRRAVRCFWTELPAPSPFISCALIVTPAAARLAAEACSPLIACAA
jgi:AraC family transcriptional regulator